MTIEEILKELTKVFAKVLERDNIQLHENTTAGDVEGWDSLSHVQLISEVERRRVWWFSSSSALTRSVLFGKW